MKKMSGLLSENKEEKEAEVKDKEMKGNTEGGG
jgi:hypothetical protein